MCNILHIIKYFIFLYKIYMKMVPSSYFKCLYAVLLILNCFANYSNCITSASSSFSSSIDKDGTKHAISSSNIFPIFFSAHNLISRLIIILENIMNILYRSVSNNNTFIFSYKRYIVDANLNMCYINVMQFIFYVYIVIHSTKIILIERKERN